MKVGSFVRVWDNQGDSVDVVSLETQKLHEAMSLFMKENEDTLLMLTLKSGALWYIRISRIDSWVISTPEIRATSHAYNKAFDDEVEELEAELGKSRFDT